MTQVNANPKENVNATTGNSNVWNQQAGRRRVVMPKPPTMQSGQPPIPALQALQTDLQSLDPVIQEKAKTRRISDDLKNNTQLFCIDFCLPPEYPPELQKQTFVSLLETPQKSPLKEALERQEVVTLDKVDGKLRLWFNSWATSQLMPLTNIYLGRHIGTFNEIDPFTDNGYMDLANPTANFNVEAFGAALDYHGIDYLSIYPIQQGINGGRSTALRVLFHNEKIPEKLYINPDRLPAIIKYKNETMYVYFPNYNHPNMTAICANRSSHTMDLSTPEHDATPPFEPATSSCRG